MCALLSIILANTSCLSITFFLQIRPSPRSTLFPYTTLFRSRGRWRKYRGFPAPTWNDRQCRRTERGHCRRSEEHTSELQSRPHLVCRLLLEKKKQKESPPATISNTTTYKLNAMMEAFADLLL